MVEGTTDDFKSGWRRGQIGRGEEKRLTSVETAVDDLSSEGGIDESALQKELTNLLHGEFRVKRHEEGSRAGNHRGGHRRSGEKTVFSPLTVEGAQNWLAGSGQVHRCRAVIGERREFVVSIGGGDRNDIGEGVACGIKGGRVVVAAGVAGRGDEEDSGASRPLDGLTLEGGRRGALAVAGVDHPGAVRDGVIDGGDGIGDRSGAVPPEGLEGHEVNGPVDAAHPDAVVAYGADNARDVCSVRRGIIVHRIVVPGDEIPPPDHIGGKVRMKIVDPRVEDRDDDRVAAGMDIPCLRRTDVGARRSPLRPVLGPRVVLPGIFQMPLPPEELVVRRERSLHNVVRLDMFHPRIGAVDAERFLDRDMGRELHQLRPLRQMSSNLPLHAAVQGRYRPGSRSFVKLNQNFSFPIRGFLLESMQIRSEDREKTGDEDQNCKDLSAHYSSCREALGTSELMTNDRYRQGTPAAGSVSIRRRNRFHPGVVEGGIKGLPEGLPSEEADRWYCRRDTPQDAHFPTSDC